ncbi:unnamed protein product, partial [Arabidopsis halleri]
MARRRRTVSSCFRSVFFLSSFSIWFQFQVSLVDPKFTQIWRVRFAGFASDASLISSVAVHFPSSHRRSFCHLFFLSVVFPALSLQSISSFPAPATFANLMVQSIPSDSRRRPVNSETETELGQNSVPKLQNLKFWWAWSNTSWAWFRLCNFVGSISWPIRRPVEGCSSLFLARFNFMGSLSSWPFGGLTSPRSFVSSSVVLTVLSLALIPMWRVLIGYFSDLTGNFSGFPLFVFQTGHAWVQSRITFMGSFSAHVQRSLLTGYFSGAHLPAIEATPICVQPSSAYVGLSSDRSKQILEEKPCSFLPPFVGESVEKVLVLTSQVRVTISSPVDDYVSNIIPFMSVLVLDRFETSPG